MPVRDRVDTELVPALDGFLALFKGLDMNADIGQRRAKLAELLAAAAAELPVNDRVTREDRVVPGPAGEPDISVRIYRPVGAKGTLAGLYYIHGGGMISGDVAGEDANAAMLTEQVGCVTVSVEYRLAPEHPDPAPVEDCYAGLVWFAAHAQDFGVDLARIAIYGGSAGGGLAAGTALLARDRCGPALAYQMLIYPMIDDTNTLPSTYAVTDVGIWDREANLEGWQMYLGERVGTDAVSIYAAPARTGDFSDLPPTYIDTGDLDLFLDEDLHYAARIAAAGIPLELHVYPGAYHGFDVLAEDTVLGRAAIANHVNALSRGLGIT